METQPMPAENAVDVAPPGEPSEAAAQAFYHANREGVDTWNAFVAERGLPLVDSWDF
ncbi:MAG: hypothetical protein JO290_08495 [Sphingomonadaceae bacterium]|nr:hypothetical protein [Sphingomonadaceae bacterium]